jgi:uncharacterized membrane protein YkoI
VKVEKSYQIIKGAIVRNAVILFLLVFVTAPGSALAQEQPSKDIISPSEAISIALKKFSDARIDEIELECKKEKLVYDIEIETADKEVKLILDATTGAIIYENEEEGILSCLFDGGSSK